MSSWVHRCLVSQRGQRAAVTSETSWLLTGISLSVGSIVVSIFPDVYLHSPELLHTDFFVLLNKVTALFLDWKKNSLYSYILDCQKDLRSSDSPVLQAGNWQQIDKIDSHFIRLNWLNNMYKVRWAVSVCMWVFGGKDKEQSEQMTLLLVIQSSSHVCCRPFLEFWTQLSVKPDEA